MRISVINHKGGVGKTTCAINLSHALGNRGKRVLVVDQDPQCNTTATLLSSPVEDHTLFDLYSKKEGVSIKDCIFSTAYENVFIIPNMAATSSLEVQLYQDIPKSYSLLKRLIDTIKDDYDYILYDCPPTLGLWTLQSLISSNFVIVPVTAGSKYAISGLVSAIETIEGVGRTVNPELKFLRLLINRVDLRTTVSKLTVDFIKKRFGDDKVFTTTIPENTHIQGAELAGKSVLRHNPQSIGSKKFRELAEELIIIQDGFQLELRLDGATA